MINLVLVLNCSRSHHVKTMATSGAAHTAARGGVCDGAVGWCVRCVVVGVAVCVVVCGGVCGGGSALSGENLSLEKERFSPRPPLSKETYK